MSIVDPPFARWLQDAALFATRASAPVTTRWGTTALTAERVTGLARQADAEAEADRQLAFLSKGPFAIDEHQLPIGAGWVQHLGRVVTLTNDQLGYDEATDVFVLEAVDDRATGLSTIVVLAPLAGGSA